jgi:hypothetical protein
MERTYEAMRKIPEEWSSDIPLPFFMNLFPVTLIIQGYSGVKRRRCSQSPLVPEGGEGGWRPASNEPNQKSRNLRVG